MGQTAVSVAEGGGGFIGAGVEDEKIRVKTSRFGEVEVSAEAVITMVAPILGFPEARHYFLKRHSENSPLLWLQSLENPELAFVVIDPAYLLADYQPVVSPAILEELAIKNSSRLDVLVILTIPPGGAGEITANLMAPLVFNSESRIGAQVLLDSGRYDCRWPVPLAGSSAGPRASS